MQRVHSRRSEGSEAEVDGLAEQELAKLQRQYRIIEGDRRAYSEETQNHIRKQMEAIKSLEKENEELMKDNTLAGSVQNQNQDKTNTEQLSSLLTKEDEIKEEIEEVIEETKRLDEQIRMMEKRVKQQRKNMGGVHNSHLHNKRTQKYIRVLENRLDKAKIDFNTCLSENSDLRETFDHMRLEKKTFDNIHQKLEKELVENKQKIMEGIETSTAAYEARDEAQGKMMALKEKADKDLTQYNTELKELMRIIEHDRKLKEFMRIKSEERAEMMEYELSTQRKKKDEKERGDKAEETIESYEAAFQTIKEATGIEDIDLLVAKFIEVEDKNFALFNYVNELNNEIELLQEQINENQGEMEKFKSEEVELASQRKSLLKGLEENLTLATQQADQNETQFKQTKKIIEQLKSGVDSLFNKINCDRSAITDMLGGASGVTDANMMQFLGLIEQRTNELLQVHGFVTAKESDRDGEPVAPVGLLGQGPQPGMSSVAIVPPTTGDDYDSDGSSGSDDEQRPLTQEELKNKILKGISKREAHPKKSQHPGSASSEKSPAKKKKGAK
ncbi:coiled-coil domain-containing protein 63-like [Montipora foliosa]|uniref:coiled-coil domain-containing protein 63-like n=1 Tax=Montipora foliosa TaxID=591990 RepID=UPI0035F1FB1B